MSTGFNNPNHYKLEDGTDSMDWLRKNVVDISQRELEPIRCRYCRKLLVFTDYNIAW